MFIETVDISKHKGNSLRWSDSNENRSRQPNLTHTQPKKLFIYFESSLILIDHWLVE